MQINCKNQLNFSFILGVPPVMQGGRRNWTLTNQGTIGAYILVGCLQRFNGFNFLYYISGKLLILFESIY